MLLFFRRSSARARQLAALAERHKRRCEAAVTTGASEIPSPRMWGTKSDRRNHVAATCRLGLEPRLAGPYSTLPCPLPGNFGDWARVTSPLRLFRRLPSSPVSRPVLTVERQRMSGGRSTRSPAWPYELLLPAQGRARPRTGNQTTGPAVAARKACRCPCAGSIPVTSAPPGPACDRC